MVSMRSLFNQLAILAVAVFVCGVQAGHAQVQIEGTVSYKLTRFGKGPWSAQGAIDRIANYDYNDHQGVRAALVFSGQKYKKGSTLKGFTIASAQIGVLSARTYLDNISLIGQARIKRGKFNATMILVDEDNRILSAVPLPKKVFVRSSFNRSSNGAKHLTHDSTALEAKSAE